MYRSVFLHEHGSDNAVQLSGHHRHQHAHPRRPKEHRSEMASPGNVSNVYLTLPSSSAVAERPRDGLCPSVVSLNKIIPRVESFIIVT